MCRVLIGYIDESGNTGDPMAGGSLTYALGCVLIDADLWPSAFDEMLEFRRRLKVTFGVPMRTEIKANYLLRNAGTLRAYQLGPSARYLIYRAHLRMIEHLPARAFAVVVDKRASSRLPGKACCSAWSEPVRRRRRASPSSTTRERTTPSVGGCGGHGAS
jgi:hypothetical protein